ncbi:MAG TPA: phosphonate C-P lyase system protein PhnH [Xanthobacteraceae bacterium]
MLTAGFAEPVLAAQSTFRAVLDAMARPGSVPQINAALSPPSPLSRGAAAIALTLADHDTPVWLGAALAAHDDVAAWLRFHCGCEFVTEPARAAFAFAGKPADVPDFAAFNLGTADYPDRSTTLVLQVRTLAAGAGLTLTGPGIRGHSRLLAEPLPHDMTARLAQNHALFPRGVDLLLATDDAVAAIPRSVRVTQEA